MSGTIAKNFHRLTRLDSPPRDLSSVLQKTNLFRHKKYPRLEKIELPQEISTILSQTDSNHKVPLEIYLVAQRVAKIKKGIYHYDADGHILELLSDGSADIRQFRDSLFHPQAENAAAAVIITAVWDKILPIYGNRGYRLVLLEAGQLGQKLTAAARSLNFDASVSSDFHDWRVNEILDIESETESPLNMVFLE